ncbi:hypothetical protein HOD29_06915 [archaeon]|jgi:hypothetical protein|nr:hypothetical protein [archaeon]
MDANIKDYSQIKNNFDEIYTKISQNKFNAKVKILGAPKIYRHTNGSTACLRRGVFGMPNKIFIREMPIHEMFYELSHEAGHNIKPHLEDMSLHAEETKACLFQNLFSQEIKNKNFEWLNDFIIFEKLRRDHISRINSKYEVYHNAAEYIIGETGNDLFEGIDYICSKL